MAGHVLVWRKWFDRAASEKWLLQAPLDISRRAIFFEDPKNHRVRLEIYPANPSESAKLKKKWGGRAINLSPLIWWKPQEERASPLRIGKKLFVVVNQKQASALSKRFPDRKIIIIPQGLAFGSGQHATTRMCLQEVMMAMPFDSILDLGTGSGILSIAAAKSGCLKVDAFDYDPTAIRVAKENNILNKLKIPFKVATLEKVRLRQKYDVVIANLFSELLIQNAKAISSWIQRQGHLIISGIRKNQQKEVKKAFSHLILTKERHANGWCCFVFRR